MDTMLKRDRWVDFYWVSLAKLELYLTVRL